MGVKLGGLVEAKKVAIADLSGRTLALDGHNILYQFLAVIRGRGGNEFADSAVLQDLDPNAIPAVATGIPH